MASRKRQAASAEGNIKKVKRRTTPEPADTPKPDPKSACSREANKFLADLNAYILPAGIEKARLGIFKTQICKNGGKFHEDCDAAHNLSHIIVDDKMDIPRMLRLMQLEEVPDVPVVKSAWLSLCLRKKEMISCEDYRLQGQSPSTSGSSKKANDPHDKNQMDIKESHQSAPAQQDIVKSSPVWHSHHKPNVVSGDSDSDYEPSDDDTKTEESLATSTTQSKGQYRQVPVEKWICAQSSKNPKPNFNKHITDKLEEMVKAYESTNDKWRAFGYQKAIQALRRHPKEISSWEEAKSLPAVGGRLADKIWEIAQSGELRKLKEFESSEEVQVLKLFTDVWGAGPHTAQVWYQQGFRTIADLKEKANLTHQQKVGVRLYDDLLDRMPREEAGEIEQVVKEAAESIQEGIIAQACGSYRRGKPTCGDVDVLITHPDGKSHKGIFHKLLTKLKESGFLTDDLVSAEETGNQKKYLGVCKLPGENRKHRRLDIIVVPYDEYGCALVYFTGSAHFNRSLRHLCKKQNMSLNEHALKTGVVRKGKEKIFEGTVIPTPTEKSVFEAMKIPYRPPEERDH